MNEYLKLNKKYSIVKKQLSHEHRYAIYLVLGTNNMINNTYHTLGTVPKSNKK
jgi:hypothetical protein